MVISKILDHLVMQTFQIWTFYYIALKITFINITSNLTGKVSKYWEAVKLTVVNTSFPKFQFLLQSLNYIYKYCHFFPLGNDRLVLLIKNKVFSVVVFLSKYCVL